MKLKAWIAIGFLAVLAVVAYLFWFPSELDRNLKRFVMDEGKRILKVNVWVDKVRVYPSTGEAVLSDVRIGSPEGFRGDLNALEFESIHVNFDSTTLDGKGPLIVRSIDFSNPRINYQVLGNGVNNIFSLYNKAHIGAAIVDNDIKKKNPEIIKGSHTKLVVKDLRIAQSFLSVRHRMIPKNLMADIPVLAISNIGDAKVPVTPARLTQQIMDMIWVATNKMSANRILREIGPKKALKFGIIGGELDPEIRDQLMKKR